MIHTLTLNPSVDYIVELDELLVGGLNRMQQDTKFPGGKGINVSRVLNRMDVESKALGFVGGFTGDYIVDCLNQENIQTDFVQVADDTRINVKIKTDTETEINAKGPAISGRNFEELKIRSAIFQKKICLSWLAVFHQHCLNQLMKGW